MNCRRFQQDMDEYLDGTLSPRAQAAAQEHLAGCAACRQTLDQEQHAARALAEQFRQATDALHLSPRVGQRVLAALAHERGAAAEAAVAVAWWRRWVWPLTATAAPLLLLAECYFFVQPPAPERGVAQRRLAAGGVSVQLSYVVPSYTFRHEGGFVIDALTYQTNVVNQRLQPELARLP